MSSAGRHPISMRKSKKMFTNTAKGVHPKNLIVGSPRGGIRL